MPLLPSEIQPGFHLRLLTDLGSVPAGTTAEVNSTGHLDDQWYFTVRWNTHNRLIHRFGQVEQEKKPVHAGTPSRPLMEVSLGYFEVSTVEEYLEQLEEAIESRKKRKRNLGFQELVRKESKQLRLFEDF